MANRYSRLYWTASAGRPALGGIAHAAAICCRNSRRSLIVCSASASAGLVAARPVKVFVFRSAWARQRRMALCEFRETTLGDEAIGIVTS